MPEETPSIPPVRPQEGRAGAPTTTKPRQKGGTSFGMPLLIIIAIAVSALWLNQNRLTGYENDWQAVFLTNGQVYFGKVSKQNKVELVVREIYYLQVTRPLQQTGEGEQQQNPQGELSLVKLGNELHGPTDSMVINRDHVLFIEDLKDDSNVVQAIDNYKSGK